MKNSKRVILEREFPFLKSGVLKIPDETSIRVRRLDIAFLKSVPVDESYSSSLATMSKYDRLFAVINNDLKEIPLLRERDNSTGYAYDPPIKKSGENYLTALISAGVVGFDYLLHWFRYETSMYPSDEEDGLTILKPSSKALLNEEWEKALREARQEVLIEADV